MTVTPTDFLAVCVAAEAPAAIIAAAEKFDVSNAELVSFTGYSEEVVDAWFREGGIDLNEYLGADSTNDWDMQDVLATVGATQEQVRDFLIANVDQPLVVAQAVLQAGASADIVAEIVGCAASDVTAYFDHAGLGDFFAYFS